MSIEFGFRPTENKFKNEHEFSPEVRRALIKLDRLEDVFGSEKVDILGVLIEVKPMAYPYQYSYEGDDLPDFKKLKEIAEKMGLKIWVKVDPIDEEGIGGWDTLVSKNQLLIDKFLEVKNSDLVEKEKDKIIGKLLGYPETSIQAYVGEIPRLSKDEDEMLRKSNLDFNFQHAILSRDHWQEEVAAYGAKIRAATEKYLPETYQELLRSWVGERGERESGG